MSQYPTVNELLGNWSVLIAESVEFPDATDEVRGLLSKITLDNCFDRKICLASVLILRTVWEANYRIPEETQASSTACQDNRIADESWKPAKMLGSPIALAHTDRDSN